MNFDEFIKKWLGKKIDFDGYYEGQCVDLYRQYVQEVLNLPQSIPVRGAADIWSTASPSYYKLIKNTPTAVPSRGDIIIWNKRVGGGFGHVAIFLRGDVNSFVSLDQNWPTLNKVTETEHNYKNITGWLHPIGKTVSDVYKGIDLGNRESIKVCVDAWKDIFDGNYIKKEDCDRIKEEEIKRLKEDFERKSTETSIKLTELCNKSLKAKDVQQKDEINKALKKAKKDWGVVKLQSQVQGYEEICKTVAYKIAATIAEILEALKIVKKEVKDG